MRGVTRHVLMRDSFHYLQLYIHISIFYIKFILVLYEVV